MNPQRQRAALFDARRKSWTLARVVTAVLAVPVVLVAAASPGAAAQAPGGADARRGGQQADHAPGGGRGPNGTPRGRATGHERGDGPASPTRLALQAECVEGDLHRFSVQHRAGPAVEVTVTVDGRAADTVLALDPAAAVPFWVPVSEPGRTTLGWNGGSVSASQRAAPCDPQAEAAARPPASGAGRSGTRRRGGPDDPVAANDATSSERLSGDRPVADGAVAGRTGAASNRTGGPAGTDGGGAAARRSAGTTADRAADRPADAAVVTGGQVAVVTGAVSPQRTAEGIECPPSYLPVDVDADDAISLADACEPVLATAFLPSTGIWTISALVITIGLLLASLSVVAVSRRT